MRNLKLIVLLIGVIILMTACGDDDTTGTICVDGTKYCDETRRSVQICNSNILTPIIICSAEEECRNCQTTEECESAEVACFPIEITDDTDSNVDNPDTSNLCHEGDTRCDTLHANVQKCVDSSWTMWDECTLRSETCQVRQGEAKCYPDIKSDEDNTVIPDKDTDATSDEDETTTDKDTHITPDEDETTTTTDKDTHTTPDEDETTTTDKDTDATSDEDDTTTLDKDTDTTPDEDETTTTDKDTHVTPDEDNTVTPDQDVILDISPPTIANIETELTAGKDGIKVSCRIGDNISVASAKIAYANKVDGKDCAELISGAWQPEANMTCLPTLPSNNALCEHNVKPSDFGYDKTYCMRITAKDTATLTKISYTSFEVKVCNHDSDCDDDDPCTVNTCSDSSCTSSAKVCNNPPDDECKDSEHIYRYETSGTCNESNGECSYSKIDELCGNHMNCNIDLDRCECENSLCEANNWSTGMHCTNDTYKKEFTCSRDTDGCNYIVDGTLNDCTPQGSRYCLDGTGCTDCPGGNDNIFCQGEGSYSEGAKFCNPESNPPLELYKELLTCGYDSNACKIATQRRDCNGWCEDHDCHYCNPTDECQKLNVGSGYICDGNYSVECTNDTYCAMEENRIICDNGCGENGQCCTGNWCTINGDGAGTFCSGQNEIVCEYNAGCLILADDITYCGSSPEYYCIENSGCGHCTTDWCFDNSESSGYHCDISGNRILCGNDGYCDKVVGAPVSCGGGEVCVNDIGACCNVNDWCYVNGEDSGYHCDTNGNRILCGNDGNCDKVVGGPWSCGDSEICWNGECQCNIDSDGWEPNNNDPTTNPPTSFDNIAPAGGGTQSACAINYDFHNLTIHNLDDVDWYRWSMEHSSICESEPSFSVPNTYKLTFFAFCYYGSPQYNLNDSDGDYCVEIDNGKKGIKCTADHDFSLYSFFCPEQAEPGTHEFFLKVEKNPGTYDDCTARTYSLSYGI